ncbi:cytochrome P450 [Hymenobacter profundi]|uniref:Cytochrome P450 n=1 Tax=Hymenobacter profundi TaxID=1982110 RepID=A0ABS6X4F2_9BACT|nr:cytochrome P450 [Hymenobacter profundi]MBW3130713.1 cytochrome P450 [Hymenobacter profundi]
MTAIPKDKALDSTLNFLREGYHFLPQRRKRHHSDIFQMRLMGEKAVCLSGEEGAALFYNQEHFQREGALPRRILTTLMGQGGVQTLDDAAHQHRKALFMSLMTPGSLHQYSTLVAENWRAYLRRWEQLEQIELFPEVEEVLCRAACAWAGVPFEEKDIKPLARDLSAMIDAFGGVGPRHAKGKLARHRAERWVGKMIDNVRAGKQYAVEGKALHAISWHRELDGKLLSTHVAGVELLNLIRPIVAIGHYVVFEALALHEHPRCAEMLRNGPAQYPEWFTQEVRRLYPFTPLLGARVRADFEWHGYRFRKGTLTLLDVHGINHDERQWEHPHLFRPERFRDWNGSPFNFIPQGGGDYAHNHRCAGEWLTIETMKTAAVLLATSMTYDVPEQDLSVDMTRMPTLPASGFIIRNVRAAATAVAPIATAPTVAAAAAGCPFH